MVASRARKTSKPVTGNVSGNQVAKGAINPSLKSLDALAGDWIMELSNAAFLSSSSDKVSGHAAFEWSEHGAVLAMRMGAKLPEATDAVWLIGRDEAAPDYQVFYFDSRGISRVYQMSFSGGVWKMWRNAPGFSQRYEGTLSRDGNTISARWETSHDGVEWKHDFDVTYRRVK